MMTRLFACALLLSSLATAGTRRPHPEAAALMMRECSVPTPPSRGRGPDEELIPRVFSADDSPIADWAWSPDEKTVLVWWMDHFGLADVATGKLLSRFEAKLQQSVASSNAFCQNVAGFSSDGEWLFATDLVGVTVLERATGRITGFVNRPYRVANTIEVLSVKSDRRVALGPGGRLLALRDNRELGKVALIDVASEEDRLTHQVPGTIAELVLDPAGTSLLVLFEQSKTGGGWALRRIEVASGALVWERQLGSATGVGAVEFAVVTAKAEARVRVASEVHFVRLSDGTLSRTHKVLGGGRLSPSGDRTFLRAGENLQLVDARTHERVAGSKGRWFDRGFSDFAVASDGALAFVALGDEAGLGFIAPGATVPERYAFQGREHPKLVVSTAGTLAFSPDGQRLYAVDRQHVVRAFERAGSGLKETASRKLEARQVRELIVSPTGAQLGVQLEALDASSVVVLLSASTLAEQRRIEGAWRPRWSAAAPRFAYGVEGKTARSRVEDLDGRLLASLEGVSAPTPSPDGSTLVAWRAQPGALQRVRLSLPEGKVVSTGSQHAFANLANVSPSGDFAVFRPPQEETLLFGFGLPDQRLDPTWSRYFTFTADGQQLYAASRDGSIARWELKPRRLAADVPPSGPVSWESLAERAYGHARFAAALERAVPSGSAPAGLDPPPHRALLGAFATRERTLSLRLLSAGELYAGAMARRPCAKPGGANKAPEGVYGRLSEALELAAKAFSALPEFAAISAPLNRAVREAKELPSVGRAMKSCSDEAAREYERRLKAVGEALGEAFDSASAPR